MGKQSMMGWMLILFLSVCGGVTQVYAAGKTEQQSASANSTSVNQGTAAPGPISSTPAVTTTSRHGTVSITHHPTGSSPGGTTYTPNTVDSTKTTPKTTLKPIKPSSTTGSPKPQSSKTTPKPNITTPNPQPGKTTLKPNTTTPTPKSSNTTLSPNTTTPTPQSGKTTLKPNTTTPTPKSRNTTLSANTKTPTPKSSNTTLSPNTTTPTPQSGKTTLKPNTTIPTPKSRNTTLSPNTTTPTPQSGKTTLKPNTTTPRPQSSNTTLNPNITTPKPQTSNTTLNPNISTPTPQSSNTTLNPNTTTTPRPSNTTLNPNTTTSLPTSQSGSTVTSTSTHGHAKNETTGDHGNPQGNTSVTMTTVTTSTMTPPHLNIQITEVVVDTTGKEKIELKVTGDKSKLKYYTVYFFDGKENMYDKVQLSAGDVNENGYLLMKRANNYRLRQHLSQSGTVMFGVYFNQPAKSKIDKKGLTDVVVIATDITKLSNTVHSIGSKEKIVILTSSDVHNGFSAMKCSDGRRGWKKGMTPSLGKPNPSCAPTQTNDDSSHKIKVTVAVVSTCLVIFFIIVILVIVYMRRKQEGIRRSSRPHIQWHFQLSPLGDDDDELILNMENPSDDYTACTDATFENDHYSKMTNSRHKPS